MARCRRLSFLTFLTRYMPWGRAPRSVIYMGFGIAHALDQLSSGHGEMAEGTLCSLMAALELAVLDNGRWDMPWMMTHLPDPPWHLLSTSPARDVTRPYGRLAPVQLSVTALQCVKEMATFDELRRKHGGGWNADGGGGASAEAAAARAKAKGGGRGQQVASAADR